MSLTTLTADIKNDLTEGLDYVEGLVGRLKAAAPGIITTAEQVSSSSVGALIEALAGKVLPADVETELASIVKTYATRFGTPAPTTEAPQPAAAPAAATPATPATPAS